MNKRFILPLSIFLGLATSFVSITTFNDRKQSAAKQVVLHTDNIPLDVKLSSFENQFTPEDIPQNNLSIEDEALLASIGLMKPESQLNDPSTESVKIIKTPDPVIASSTRTTSVSRGNTSPKTETVKVNESSKSKTELLDWGTANKVFSIGSVVEVTDVYTKKTFKIKRTMGSNHADCEALTKEDTQIIKSIWGGFSWDVRPIIINVKGRKLAASMSSLPHAGVDSAPAFAVVDNRSEGYGRGENLDAVKGNGMDGHFDVHFLNSRRHKDGKIDPKHQAAVKVAARK